MAKPTKQGFQSILNVIKADVSASPELVRTVDKVLRDDPDLGVSPANRLRDILTLFRKPPVGISLREIQEAVSRIRRHKSEIKDNDMATIKAKLSLIHKDNTVEEQVVTFLDQILKRDKDIGLSDEEVWDKIANMTAANITPKELEFFLNRWKSAE